MDVCPKSPWWLVANDDPTLRLPRPCGTYRCSVCRAAKIRERLRVLVWGAARANRVRLVTLTQLPSDWQKARGQVRDLVRRLRAERKLEWGWSIEANPKGTGYHAHAIQWGDYLPQSWLQRKWGSRICHIMEVNKGAAGYLTKCAAVCGYLTKSMEEHLLVNGGRAVHLTRGFLHGRTSREVLKEMSSGRKWHLEHATAEEIAYASTRQ